MIQYCKEYDEKICESQCLKYWPEDIPEYKKEYCSCKGMYVVWTTDSFIAQVMEALDES